MLRSVLNNYNPATLILLITFSLLLYFGVNISNIITYQTLMQWVLFIANGISLVVLFYLIQRTHLKARSSLTTLFPSFFLCVLLFVNPKALHSNPMIILSTLSYYALLRILTCNTSKFFNERSFELTFLFWIMVLVNHWFLLIFIFYFFSLIWSYNFNLRSILMPLVSLGCLFILLLAYSWHSLASWLQNIEFFKNGLFPNLESISFIAIGVLLAVEVLLAITIYKLGFPKWTTQKEQLLYFFFQLIIFLIWILNGGKSEEVLLLFPVFSLLMTNFQMLALKKKWENRFLVFCLLMSVLGAINFFGLQLMR